METVGLWVKEEKSGALSAKTVRPLNAKYQTSGYCSLRATARSRPEKGLSFLQILTSDLAWSQSVLVFGRVILLTHVK